MADQETIEATLQQIQSWGNFTGKDAIKERRYHDDTVLLHDKKLKHNNIIELIEERKDGSRRFDTYFYVSKETAKKYKLFQMPTRSGGMAPMRPVPFEALKPLKLDRRVW